MTNKVGYLLTYIKKCSHYIPKNINVILILEQYMYEYKNKKYIKIFQLIVLEFLFFFQQVYTSKIF